MSCRVLVVTALILAGLVDLVAAQTSRGQPGEWDKIVEAGKEEGKVVVSIPPSRKLRRAMEVAFTRRYGIGVEFVSVRSNASIQKMISEGRSINVTLIFSLERYEKVIDAYIDGVEVADPLYIANIDPKSIERVEVVRGVDDHGEVRDQSRKC